MSKPRFLIGIDPGVKTGLATWDRKEQRFTLVQSSGILDALNQVLAFVKVYGEVELWFEDARLRKWFGKAGREKLQGAGSIKRDCSIWQEFCEKHCIKFLPIKPAAGSTKWNANRFKKTTGWNGKTNEHSRDAALLIFGAK